MLGRFSRRVVYTALDTHRCLSKKKLDIGGIFIGVKQVFNPPTI